MTESKDPREEAERLIASVLGSASVAAENLSGFATGSAECCVCPVCKAIAAAREPNPKVAEKLATGAGDLASGVASFLRTMARAASDLGGAAAGTGGSAGSGTSGAPGGSGAAGGSGDAGSSRGWGGTTVEDPWHTATRAAAEAEAAAAAAATGPGAGAARPGAAPASTTASPEGGAAASATGASTDERAPGAAEPAATPNPPKPMAKKAVKPKAPAEPPADPTEER